MDNVGNASNGLGVLELQSTALSKDGIEGAYVTAAAYRAFTFALLDLSEHPTNIQISSNV